MAMVRPSTKACLNPTEMKVNHTLRFGDFGDIFVFGCWHVSIAKFVHNSIEYPVGTILFVDQKMVLAFQSIGDSLCVKQAEYSVILLNQPGVMSELHSWKIRSLLPGESIKFKA